MMDHLDLPTPWHAFLWGFWAPWVLSRIKEAPVGMCPVCGCCSCAREEESDSDNTDYGT